jgi:Kef-type K+ transport system membrane component KefB
MGDKMRDWYLASVFFNTLALLIYNRLLRYVFFIKLTLQTGLYHVLGLLEIVILSLMIIITTLYITVNTRNKAGKIEDTLAMLITAVAIYNLISGLIIWTIAILYEGV